MSYWRISSHLNFGNQADRDLYATIESDVLSTKQISQNFVNTTATEAGFPVKKMNATFTLESEAKESFDKLRSFFENPDIAVIALSPLAGVIKDTSSINGKISVHRCFNDEPDGARYPCSHEKAEMVAVTR